MTRRIISYVQRHPLMDSFLPVVVVTVMIIVLPHIRPTRPSGMTDLLVGLSALAGMLMALITFTCTFTYGSESMVMKEIRERFSKNLSRNWFAMAIYSLIAAILPLAAILFNGVAEFAFAAAAIILILEEFARCVFWIRLTLFFDHVSADRKPDDFDTEKAIQKMRSF